MSTMVQIRNVPAEFHRRLKIRAASEGLTMSDFILREVGKVLSRPSREDVLARLRSRPIRTFKQRPAAVLRESREKR